MTKRSTASQFIRKAKKKHGDHYDYSKVDYVKVNENVTIICPIHGDFDQTPNSHLNGSGCNDCGRVKSAKKRSKPKSQFLSEAKQIFGDRFDYSEFEYVTTHSAGIIRCIKHNHKFPQRPATHLKGHIGCEFCSGAGKSSTENFIRKAKKKHGDHYDYSKVDYVKVKENVTIICPVHEEFDQTPDTHLHGNAGKGSGCILCGIEKNRNQQRKSTAEVISLFKNIHENKYEYSKVEYNGYHKNVTIICSIHGDFQQSPANHIARKGCNNCGIERTADQRRMKKPEFIEKARVEHGYEYDYSKVSIINLHSNVKIICPDHGEFAQTPDNHLHGHGCDDCGGSKKLTIEKFILMSKEEHGDRYDYSKSEYVNNKTEVRIICPDHGGFDQYPSNHYRENGSGCPKCKNKHEGKIAEYLKEKNIVYREFQIDNRYYDFYLPDYNLLIERDGEQHYRFIKYFGKSLEEVHLIDIEKTNLAITNNFRIARIPYWLDFNEVKTEIHNILAGNPSFPNIPDLQQEKTKPKP